MTKTKTFTAKEVIRVVHLRDLESAVGGRTRQKELLTLTLESTGTP